MYRYENVVYVLRNYSIAAMYAHKLIKGITHYANCKGNRQDSTSTLTGIMTR